jgi:hypothetical protein
VTDLAGTATLGTGIHTLVLEVSGGDGCVEIDTMTLSPRAPTDQPLQPARGTSTSR